MPIKISFKDCDYLLENGETVLDGLLRHGQDAPNSCKAGACQSCLMQARQGSPGDKAQKGLKETLKAQNYFLACQCVPEEDLKIDLPSLSSTTIIAEIIGKETLCHNVIALRLKPLEDFPCRAGQYINILIDDGATARSYSIANLPNNDNFIEIHIRKINKGRMSVWVHEKAQKGEKIRIRGPAGDCFYTTPEANHDFPIVLAGTGTGLAPIEGIALDALSQGHTGDIHLIHGALRYDDLYHVEKLRALSNKHKNFFYTPCVLNAEENPEGVHTGAIDKFVEEILKPFEKSKLHTFFCGDPATVNLLKKTAFLAGVSSKNIFSDPFITAAAPGSKP